MADDTEENKNLPFPEVPSSIWLTIFFSGALLTTLYFMSEGGTRPVDPVFMYLILGTLLIVLGISVRGWGPITRTLGFDAPDDCPGANIFMAIIGVGFGMLVVGLVTKPLMVLFAGNSGALSIIQPLYMPLSVEPYMFTLPSAITGTLIGVCLFYIVVGVGEQIFHVIIWKNLSNSIQSSRLGKRIPVNLIVLIAFIISGMVFSTWHLLSWGSIALNPMQMVFAIVILLIFYMPYLIPDVIGIFTPETPIAWKQVLLMGSVTGHAAYDTFLTTDIGLIGQEMVGIGIGLVVISLVGMWISRWVYTKKYIVAPF